MDAKLNPLSETPSFALLLGLCGAIFMSTKFPAVVSCAVALLVCASWILCGTSQHVKNWTQLFILSLVLTLILSCVSVARLNFKKEYPKSLNCLGTIIAERSWGKNRSALVISTEYGKVVAYVNSKTVPETGSKILLNAKISDFKTAVKKGAFDERMFWKARGADKKCVPRQLKQVAQPNIFYRFRNSLEKNIKKKLPKRTAEYMLAITLGERSKTLSLLHKGTGTSHLLAVSGFHVAILAGMVAFVFRRKKYRVLLTSVFIWGYVLLSGAAPGAMRAAIMLQLVLVSRCLGVPANSFNTVSVAGILLLMFNPYNFFDLGWRLSMLCALFICTAENSFDFISASLISMLLWFVTAAQVSFSMKTLPVAGLFVNIIAVPLFAFLYPLIFVCSVFRLLSLPLGAQLANMCEYLLEAWEIFSNIVTSAIPWSFHYTPIMLTVSAFVFFWYAAQRCRYPKMNCAIASVLATIFVFISSQM